MNILLVCTGNTCRSSMAQGIFENVLDECGDDSINVDSAGINVYVSTSATESAVQALSQKGIDISDHMSKQVSKEDIVNADLVLVMTSSHKNVLIDLYPKYSDKIYTLLEYAYGSVDKEISDPFGMDDEEYENCANQIEDAIKAVYEKIKNNA